MDKYIIKMTWGDTLEMECNLSEASAPIIVDGDYSPYQTADARHRLTDAARLAVLDQGRDWWLSPCCEIGEDEDGEATYDGLSESAYIDSIIDSIEEM